MPGPELVAKLVGGLADDFQVAANGVRDHFVIHPIALRGDGVLENPIGRVSDVNEVQYRVFHSLALKRDRFEEDAIADVGV